MILASKVEFVRASLSPLKKKEKKALAKNDSSSPSSKNPRMRGNSHHSHHHMRVAELFVRLAAIRAVLAFVRTHQAKATGKHLMFETESDLDGFLP